MAGTPGPLSDFPGHIYLVGTGLLTSEKVAALTLMTIVMRLLRYLIVSTTHVSYTLLKDQAVVVTSSLNYSTFSFSTVKMHDMQSKANQVFSKFPVGAYPRSPL